MLFEGAIQELGKSVLDKPFLFAQIAVAAIWLQIQLPRGHSQCAQAIPPLPSTVNTTLYDRSFNEA